MTKRSTDGRRASACSQSRAWRPPESGWTSPVRRCSTSITRPGARAPGAPIRHHAVPLRSRARRGRGRTRGGLHRVGLRARRRPRPPAAPEVEGSNAVSSLLSMVIPPLGGVEAVTTSEGLSNANGFVPVGGHYHHPGAEHVYAVAAAVAMSPGAESPVPANFRFARRTTGSRTSQRVGTGCSRNAPSNASTFSPLATADKSLPRWAGEALTAEVRRVTRPIVCSVHRHVAGPRAGATVRASTRVVGVDALKRRGRGAPTM